LLSAIVGVPPETFTASLKFSVSITVLPGPRSPLPGDNEIPTMAGLIVSMIRSPGGT
jgi:hypothetical protein